MNKEMSELRNRVWARLMLNEAENKPSAFMVGYMTALRYVLKEMSIERVEAK